MDCVNHQGVAATAYCQNCGKPLCGACVRNGGNGQILCEPCYGAWQNMQQPFVGPPAGGPNPSVAGVLGLIPGVGAMYNGQYFKGLIHVVIFVVIISITTHYGLSLDCLFRRGFCIRHLRRTTRRKRFAMGSRCRIHLA